MDTVTAYKTLGLKQDAGAERVKKQYRALVKKCHPDTGYENSTAIKAINIAYEIVMEEIERLKAEKITISYNLEMILKGIRLAMKKYVNELAISKKKNIIRTDRLKEFIILLEYLKSLDDNEKNDEHALAVSFIKGVITFEKLPVNVKTLNVKERKGYLIYNMIIKQVIRVFEEVFIRLDGIKKRTGLWRYYISKSLDDYNALLETDKEKFGALLSFLPGLFDDIKEIAYIFRAHTSLLSYKDFFDIFARDKLVKMGILNE